MALSVVVDGTFSTPAPNGKDTKGRTAPNAVVVSYLGDAMVSSGVVIKEITTSDSHGLGGFVGYGSRHYQCTRNYKSYGKLPLHQCAQKCVLQFPSCTMFSWGSVSKSSPVECRISLSEGNNQQGCSPEYTPTTTNNPILNAFPNVPTLYTVAIDKTVERTHGAFSGDRVASHSIQPQTGGIVVGAQGYQQHYQATSTPDEQALQSSSDVVLKKGETITVQLNVPMLVQKVTARQATVKTADTSIACQAKTLKFLWPDGSSTKLTFTKPKRSGNNAFVI